MFRRRKKFMMASIAAGVLGIIIIGIAAVMLLSHNKKSQEYSAKEPMAIEDTEVKGDITNEDIKEETVRTDMKTYLFDYIFIPEQIKKGEIFDIRIFFPNGEDYVVASGKCIEDRSEQGVYINVTENELFLISGAYVDTMIYDGAKMYASKYIAANQELSKPNYPVNIYISKLSQWNPNFREEIDIETNTEKRKILEDNLFDFMGINIGNSYDSSMDF